LIASKLDETYYCGCSDPPLASSSLPTGGEVIGKKEPTRVDKITRIDMIKGSNRAVTSRSSNSCPAAARRRTTPALVVRATIF